jgi:chloramphenicol O-acetyltransferase type A
VKETYTLLDMQSWPRKQHFEFYKTFAQPFFQIGCDLDAKVVYHYCKENSLPFFDAYLFLTMKTINQLEPFRRRVVDDEVRIYQKVMISVAVMAPDETFRFCDIPYAEDFRAFSANFKAAKDKAISEPFFNDSFAANQANKGTVYMSVIPWVSFTSFNHASHSNDPTGIPRMVFGKMRKSDYSMPFTLDAHHALVDGLHVGQFIEVLQGYFDKPELPG